jgi:homoserine kinase type II
VRARDGAALRRLAGRPAMIATFLTGMWPRTIKTAHCAALGGALARLHAAGADFAMTRPNDLSYAGWQALARRIDPAEADAVEPGLAGEIMAELDWLGEHWPGAQGRSDLPGGTIHADLFPDNVFFENDHLTGFIDFYFACTDWLAYDLATCLNAWCFTAEGIFAPALGHALIQSYMTARPLQGAEITALPILARGAALRFLLTRLYDWINHPEGALVRKKDPLEYRRKLAFHQSVRGIGDYGM